MNKDEIKRVEHFGLPEFRALVHLLRSPEGCPWDRVQTHESLRKNLLEESLEVIAAIDKSDYLNLREELGDVLLQVVFHADLAEEEGRFTLDDVIDAVGKKLVSRHTHVFGEDVLTGDPSQALSLWEQNKRKEKQTEGDLTGEAEVPAGLRALREVPLSAPPLFRANKLQKRAADVGFDWPDPEGALQKIHEELAESRAAVTKAEKEEELGDLLFAVVNYMRLQKIDPCLALERCNRKFLSRFEKMYELSAARGEDFEKLDLEAQDAYWNLAKEAEKQADSPSS